MAPGELVHSAKVDWVPLLSEILGREDLSISRQDVSCVLFKQTDEPQVELSVSFDRVSIVGDGLDQLALLNVHRLHAEAVFLLL